MRLEIRESFAFLVCTFPTKCDFFFNWHFYIPVWHSDHPNPPKIAAHILLIACFGFLLQAIKQENLFNGTFWMFVMKNEKIWKTRLLRLSEFKKMIKNKIDEFYDVVGEINWTTRMSCGISSENSFVILWGSKTKTMDYKDLIEFFIQVDKLSLTKLIKRIFEILSLNLNYFFAVFSLIIHQANANPIYNSLKNMKRHLNVLQQRKDKFS